MMGPGGKHNAPDPLDETFDDEDDAEAKQDYDDFKTWLDAQDSGNTTNGDSTAVAATPVEKPRDPVPPAVCNHCKKGPGQCNLYQLD